MNTADLFEPFSFRGLRFRNRVAMAAMTRARMGGDGVPKSINVEYYRQRASAGLILTEAVAVSPGGRGGWGTPGLYTEAQTAGWREVTDAVHRGGGLVFAQLWHAGRLGHSSLDEQGAAPLAPSAAQAVGEVHIEAGPVPFEMPRVASREDIANVIKSYRHAAKNAKAAGFDGVELHAGHGYLIDSFLRNSFNMRDDIYGGPVENRARLLVEVLRELLDVFGGDRVSVRVSPNATYGGMKDPDAAETYGYLVAKLNECGVAWLDMIEGDNLITREVPGGADTDAMIARFAGAVIVGHGYDLAMATQTRIDQRADMIAFGRPFIANPDLVERLVNDATIKEAPREVWYGDGPAGYTDFPSVSPT